MAREETSDANCRAKRWNGVLKQARKAAEARVGPPHDFRVTAPRVVEQALGDKLSGEPLDDPKRGNPAAAEPAREAGGGWVLWHHAGITRRG